MVKTEINKFGNIIERNFILSGNRYRYDFQKCKAEDGWKQFDTNQDAWYFGIWCNQKKLQIMCYVEGDNVNMRKDIRAKAKTELERIVKEANK